MRNLTKKKNIFIKEFQIIWRETDLWWKHSDSSAHRLHIHNSCIVFFIYYRFLSGGPLFIPLYSMVEIRKRFVGESSLICVWLNGLMWEGKKWEFWGLRKRPKWNHDDCCVQNTWYSSSNSWNKEKSSNFCSRFFFLFSPYCSMSQTRETASSTEHSDMLGKECAWWMPSTVHMESGS